MKFILIDATAQTARVGDYRNLTVAEAAVGLEVGGVDHGTLVRGLGYVVSEFGLFDPVDEQRYFAIGTLLVAGNCVCYAYDQSGQTTDIESIDFAIRFFKDVPEIERAIEQGLVLRPRIAVDNQEIWRWPDPAPSGFLPV